MKFLKRAAIFVGVLLLLLLGTAVVAVTFFENAMGQQLITQINRQLRGELSVERFDLTVLSSFPSASINLRDVVLMDSRGGVLLEAEELACRLSLFSLFTRQVQVKSVLVSNGALNISIDRKGQGNYDIMKPSPEEEVDEEGRQTGLSLSQARLKDVELIYEDATTAQAVMLTVKDAVFSGQFSDARFSLKSNADLVSNFIDVAETRFLAGKRIKYDAVLNVDMAKGLYDIERARLDIESNGFRIEGSVQQQARSSMYDLVFMSEAVSLASMLTLLPDSYLKSFGDFKSSGQFEVLASIKGEATASQNPEVRMQMSFENGKISKPTTRETIEDVRFLAIFNNGKRHTNADAVFEIRDCEGSFSGERFTTSLRVANMDDPRVSLQINGAVPAALAVGFLGHADVTNGQGRIAFNKLFLEGRYEDMLRPDRMEEVAFGGSVSIDEVLFNVKAEELRLSEGLFNIDGQRFSLDSIRMTGAGSDLRLSGSATNLLAVLLADSLNEKGVTLLFEAVLTASEMDLDRLMALSFVSEAEEAAAESQAVLDSLRQESILRRERLGKRLRGSFEADVRSFNYNKIEGRDFKGQLSFANNQFLVKGITQAMGGGFELEGLFDLTEEPSLRAKLITREVDFREFFRQGDNFGQEVLLAENVNGALNSRIIITAQWNREGQFLEDKLEVLAGVNIRNGELIGLKMLEDFSTFVKVKDLRHIRFTNMENILQVRDRKLVIPAMFLQSNALNLTISGLHSFDHDIRYFLKVNAGQVLINRFKSHDRQLKPQKARKGGFFNLYYSIIGNLDDYEMESSKSAVNADFQRTEALRRTLQTALERSFGIPMLITEPESWQDDGPMVGS